MTAITARVGGIRWGHPRTIGVFGIALGALAFWLALPPVAARTAAAADFRRHDRDLARHLGLGPRRAPGRRRRDRRRPARDRPRAAGDALVDLASGQRGRLELARGGDASLRDAADLCGDRRAVLRAERRDQRRARRNAPDGCVLRHLGRHLGELVGRQLGVDDRAPDRGARRHGNGGDPRRLGDPPEGRPDHLRHRDQLHRARLDRLHLHRQVRRQRHPRRHSRASPTCT